jgi:LmbE family N-acetylglucosaminyl deacetylase
VPPLKAPLRLLCVLAHPDDESLGCGGTLAKYGAEGVETYVLCATRGERGRFGDVEPRPEPETVGRAREAELRAAAGLLGVRGVDFLGYVDADLDQAPPSEAVARIARHIRRIRPHVVITFGPDGGYGHPDHIAISQFATAAVLTAAVSADPAQAAGRPHAVSKLYYMAWDETQWSTYQSTFKSLSSTVDGRERRAVPWRDWSITTEVDAGDHWETVWRAVQCHRTQLSVYSKLSELAPQQHRRLWGRQTYYRVFSTVNGGRARETDLFAGLRSGEQGDGAPLH